MTSRITLAFTPRDEPLRPSGVVAFGAAARALAARVLDCFEGAYAGLEGIVGDDVIVLLGDEERLPFTEGVVYVGVDAGVLSVLLPTTHAPNVPVQWLVSMLEEQRATLPVAVVPRDEALHVIPVGTARSVSRTSLEAFIARVPS